MLSVVSLLSQQVAALVIPPDRMDPGPPAGLDHMDLGPPGTDHMGPPGLDHMDPGQSGDHMDPGPPPGFERA